MKTILNKVLAISCVGLFLLASCKKDETKVISNGGKPGTLTTSSTTPVLNKASVNDTTAAIKFTFTPPDFGFSAAVTNTLQIDSVGDNWKKPTSVTLGSKNIFPKLFYGCF